MAKRSRKLRKCDEQVLHYILDGKLIAVHCDNITRAHTFYNRFRTRLNELNIGKYVRTSWNKDTSIIHAWASTKRNSTIPSIPQVDFQLPYDVAIDTDEDAIHAIKEILATQNVMTEPEQNDTEMATENMLDGIGVSGLYKLVVAQNIMHFINGEQSEEAFINILKSNGSLSEEQITFILTWAKGGKNEVI